MKFWCSTPVDWDQSIGISRLGSVGRSLLWDSLECRVLTELVLLQFAEPQDFLNLGPAALIEDL